MLYSWVRAYSPPLQSFLVPDTFKEIPKVSAVEQYFSYVTEENSKKAHRRCWRKRMKFSYDLHSFPSWLFLSLGSLPGEEIPNGKWCVQILGQQRKIPPRSYPPSCSWWRRMFSAFLEAPWSCLRQHRPNRDEHSELESQPGSVLSSSLNDASCLGKKKGLSNVVGLDPELSLW